MRHIESMIRMSEAHAKMHLRDFVRSEDINMGIQMLLKSFLQSQKQSVASALKPKFAKYLTHADGDFEVLQHLLSRLAREKARLLRMDRMEEEGKMIDVEIPKRQFVAEAREVAPASLEKFFLSKMFGQNARMEGDKILTRSI